MGRKTVDSTKSGLSNLPEDKPVVYKVLTEDGANNYTGVAKRGRVQERLSEHLPGEKNYIPGSKVQIEQIKSIKEAKQKESRIITRSKPKHNKQGK